MLEVPMMASLGPLPMTPAPSCASASWVLSEVGSAFWPFLAAVAVFIVVKRRSSSSSDVDEIDEEDGFDGMPFG